MIQALWLRRSCHPLKNDYRLVTIASTTRRNLSSVGAIRPHPRRRAAATPFLPSHTLWRRRQWPPTGFNAGITARFASTDGHSSPVADIQSDFASTSSNPSAEGFLSTSLEDVTSSVPTPAYDHMGFLKEMGLDYGWGTTAMVENLFELVHINAGTPWWATIGLSLLIVRLVLLKPYFAAADTSARNLMIAQYQEPMMARMKAAKGSQDQAGMARAWKEMSDLRASAGIKYYKMLVPLIQIPIGFGVFRLVRGMSHLPVPGLDSGGLLWMQDLTLSDPYFILPVLTAASYYYTFKAGGETGASNPLMTPAIKKLFLYGLPVFSGAIMIAWPGALQVTFFIQAIISMTQSAALRQDWLRKMVGIQPLPKPSDTKPKTAYTGTMNRQTSAGTSPGAKEQATEGMFAGIKDLIAAGKKKTEEFQQSRQPKAGGRTPGELRHAQAYEARRKREIAQEKFEKEQLRAEKRNSRR